MQEPFLKKFTFFSPSEQSFTYLLYRKLISYLTLPVIMHYQQGTTLRPFTLNKPYLFHAQRIRCTQWSCKNILGPSDTLHRSYVTRSFHVRSEVHVRCIEWVQKETHDLVFIRGSYSHLLPRTFPPADCHFKRWVTAGDSDCRLQWMVLDAVRLHQHVVMNVVKVTSAIRNFASFQFGERALLNNRYFEPIMPGSIMNGYLGIFPLV